MKSVGAQRVTVAIGFIGADRGMSRLQHEALQRVLVDAPRTDFHFGDGAGSDADAVLLARARGLRIVAHPPLAGARRGFFAADVTLDPREPLARDDDIVKACGLLIVAPDAREVSGSPTSLAMRRARGLARRLIVLPY